MGVKIEVDQSLTKKDAMARYRVILAEEGGVVEEDTTAQLGESYEKLRKRRKGFSKDEVEQIIESGGKLNWSQVLRCKTRYFSDGLVIGTKQFVESYFQDLKDKTGHYEKRETGARKIRQVDSTQNSQSTSEATRETTTELFTMRDLKKNRFL